MRITIFTMLLFIGMHGFLLAQRAPEQSEGVLTGKVVDSNNKQPVEYVNIAVYNTEGTLVTGGITDEHGTFLIKDLRPGTYYLIAKFIGFDETRINDLSINRAHKKNELGMIMLTPSISQLGDIEVTAEKKAIQYKIDKKVVNPSQYLATSGGTAVDILANTPSITVDVEGNVSMRGSSNFTVLIDGKPTPFDPADALEQVPASQIENIEIITNPSVKYDPDGTSGIINIITKKKRLEGITGIVNVDANTIGSVNGDFLLNLQQNKYSFYVGGNRSDRKRKGSYSGSTRTFKGDTTNVTSQEGDGERGFSSNSLKTGFTYQYNPKTSLALNLSAGTKQRKSLNDVNYNVWKESGNFVSEKDISESTSDNISKGNFFSGDLSFEKNFEKDGHQLLSTFFYQTESSDETNINRQESDNNFISGQKSWEDGSGQEMRFKTDYTLPINRYLSVESGYQWRYDDEDEWYDLHNQIAENDVYTPGEGSPNYKTSTFTRHIHAMYATFSGETGRLGYKAGLRGEYTNRKIDFSAVSEPYSIDRLDLFPSLHLSFKLPWEMQLMASYSKRIERPRSHYLEPFETWMDSYTVRQGNPDLKPEYIDSYELGIQRTFSKGFFSIEGFYRETENRIDRIQSVYIDPVTNDTANNIILMSSANAGKDFALGLEGMVNYELNKWWTINLNGNFFNYRIESSLLDQKIEKESTNWGFRLSNTFIASKSNRIQIDAMYHSPSISSQGERDGFMFTNIAVKQDFFKKRLGVTLSVQDVLNTATFHMTSQGPGFESERKWDMESPVVQVQLSYKINNFKPQRRTSSGQGEGIDMDGGF